MDSLPDWAASIIAVAVGLSPGLALLMARPIGRFLLRTLLERPEVSPQSRREPVQAIRPGQRFSRRFAILRAPVCCRQAAARGRRCVFCNGNGQIVGCNQESAGSCG